MKNLRFLFHTFIAMAAGVSVAAAASEHLVTTDWVARNLQNPDIRILEVSVEPGIYERGHIPGAQNVRWHTDLVDPVNRDVVSKENFEKLASRLGITPATTVLIYGDHNNWFAAWGAWVFTLYGHEDVRLIDGGRAKWEAERRPVSNRPARVQSTAYEVAQVNDHLRAFLPDVVAVARGEAQKALIDIRSPDEFTGRVIAPAGIQELSIRAGHVPSAVNVPWVEAVDPATGTFKSPDELRTLYAAKGVDGSKPIIAYCRIGERSSHTWFALHFILGYEVANYDGSWTEYGNSVGVPINNPTGTVWTGK